MSDLEPGLQGGRRSYEEILKQRQDDGGHKTATTTEQVGRSTFYKTNIYLLSHSCIHYLFLNTAAPCHSFNICAAFSLYIFSGPRRGHCAQVLPIMQRGGACFT